VFVKVLVGVDGLQGGQDALALARILVAADAEITLAHVYGRRLMPHHGAILRSARLREAQQLLARERAATGLEVGAVPCAERSVGRGLHLLAEQLGADLLVVGSSRRALLGRVLLGDDTTSSLNGAPCAVAIAPMAYASTSGRLSSIGVGYDGSPESEQGLAAGRELARRYGAKVRALSVVSLQSIPYGEPVSGNWPKVARELMDDELRRLRGLEDVDGEVGYGEPGEELAQFSETVGLLVVGSRGYGPLGRLMNGSTSNYLATRTECPLLVLPRSVRHAAKADARGEGAERRAERY
jgi:nucleotide-binding universal stress UspA family protein